MLAGLVSLMMGLIIFLLVIVRQLQVTAWQQQQVIGELQSTLHQLQSQVQRDRRDRLQENEEIRSELSQIRRDLRQLGSKYEFLYKMVVADKEETRRQVGNIFSQQIALINNINITNEESVTNMTLMEHKIDENQIRVNQSMTGLAELLVHEITMCKGEASTLSERIKSLESQGPVVMIEKRIVEREYHLQRVEPQQTWGEQIGSFIGGAVQDGLLFLAQSVIRLFG